MPPLGTRNTFESDYMIKRKEKENLGIDQVVRLGQSLEFVESIFKKTFRAPCYRYFFALFFSPVTLSTATPPVLRLHRPNLPSVLITPTATYSVGVYRLIRTARTKHLIKRHSQKNTPQGHENELN